jgi:hypothetical protein
VQHSCLRRKWRLRHRQLVIIRRKGRLRAQNLAASLTLNPSSQDLVLCGIPSTSLSQLHLDGGWVTWNSERLLWIPSKYRSCSFATHENILAVGHLSGHVAFMTFERSFFAKTVNRVLSQISLPVPDTQQLGGCQLCRL